MLGTASESDKELILTDIALFEVYEAHAADEMHGIGSGDDLRANAKRLWTLVADHSTDVRVRDHAKLSIQCFFEKNQSACEKAFSATASGF